jgi:hypothetical protein
MARRNLILGFVVALVGIVALVTVAVAAEADLVSANIPRDWPLDAQSTTGPVPPAGLFEGFPPETLDYEVVIPGVPAYIGLWEQGCGPIAAGMVLGYWDGNGFDDLVEGSAVTETPAVHDMISSEGNYYDYFLPFDFKPILRPDLSEPPFGDEHPDDCVADFMKTSQSYHSNYAWQSRFEHVDEALAGYVGLVTPDYEVFVENLYWGDLTWESFCSEIDANQPMVLLVDTDADGESDHFITAIGYGEQSGTPMYACLDTWDTEIHWYEFAPMGFGQLWGIYGGTTCRLEHPVLTRINLQAPADQSVLSSPPTFAWTPDGGTDNAYAVDFGLSPSGPIYSTYETLGIVIYDTEWTMPAAIWNMIPTGKQVYWRVRGVDLDDPPLNVITSDEVWSFYKQ